MVRRHAGDRHRPGRQHGLGALPELLLAGDTSASDRFYHRDITAPFVLEDGYVRVPTGPGLGVDVDEDALAEVTVAREWVRLDG